MTPLTFSLTEDHLKLLRHASWRWEDCEWGAPAVDCKRPYGGGDYHSDVAAILGWELWDDGWGEKHISREQYERAATLHTETLTALEIIFHTGSMEPGVYRRGSSYKDKWILIRPSL